MTSRNDSNQKRKRVAEAISFIEELFWLLDSKQTHSSLQDLREFLVDVRYEVNQENKLQSRKLETATNSFRSSDPNKHLLIGILPNLFQNLDIFPTNKDIAEFTHEVLDVLVSRFEKRSRYELIGLVICKINEFEQNRIYDLVSKLTAIVESDSNIERIANEKRENKYFSWNDTIKRLTK
ncbi:hypothetical protein [Undibacterium sp. RuTC16W]|uniref:hypothetical protein n=1 Tax=Undibacterium sp. RuTC16W TaxID=3413048 RepID=UPI003BF1AAF7